MPILEKSQTLLCSYCPFDGAKYPKGAMSCENCGVSRAQIFQLGSDVLSDTMGLNSTIAIPCWSSSYLIMEKDGSQYNVYSWQRCLWKKHPLPDNYTDRKQFLSYLKSASLPRYNYWTVMRLSTLLVQPIALLAILLLVLNRLKTVIPSFIAARLVVLDFILIGVYCSCSSYTHRNFESESSKQVSEYTYSNTVKRMVVIVGLVKILSPVLHSLAQSLSQTTSNFLTVLMFSIHLITYDYEFVIDDYSDNTMRLLSFNSAIVGTALSASKLNNIDQVFAIMLFAISTLILFLPFRRIIYSYSAALHDFGLTSLLLLCVYILMRTGDIHTGLVVAFFAIILGIITIGPLAFIYASQYRSYVNGPWDIPPIPNYEII